MKVRKASRAQWHTELHADVFGLLCACSIMTSVCNFHLCELGPMISCAKPELILWLLWWLLSALRVVRSHFLFCFAGGCHYLSVHEPQKLSGRGARHLQWLHPKNEKTKNDVPPLVLIVKSHREGFLDHHHSFLLVGNIFRVLFSTGWDHVDDWTVKPTCDSDAFIIADNTASSSAHFFQLHFTLEFLICSLQPVCSACTWAIDALVFQVLDECRRSYQKTPCGFRVLYHHKDASLHLQPFLIHWCDQYLQSVGTLQIYSYSPRFLPSPTLSPPRV